MFTHIDHGFQFEELEATTLESGRTYCVPAKDGDIHYPSVTTVLGFDKKEFFKEWREMPGNKVKSETALDRGNCIHEAIEDYLNNVPDAFELPNKDYKAIVNIMKPYLNKICNIRALEVPLYSHTLKIAGRVDCVAEYEGKLSIIDFKGSNRAKKEKWIENYFMQATAYSIMWEELTGQRIDQLVIIIGNEDGYCQIFKKEIKEYVPRLFRFILKYEQHLLEEKKNETN